MLSVCLFSCAGKKTQYAFSRVWFYNSNQDTKQQVENINRYGGNMEYGMDGASFLDLQPDSSFTSYLSTFSFGRWNVQNDSILILTDQKGRILKLDVKNLTGEELICINTHNNRVYRFQGFDNHFSAGFENPFSISNNKWRIPALHRENDDQISSRLKNHFHYWEKYFNWAAVNKLKHLDIRSTPSILDMYSNGFNLQYYNYQPTEWKRNFYDSTDSWKAYEKVYYLMAAKKIKWPKTENRFERFVSAFQQMQGWLDEKK